MLFRKGDIDGGNEQYRRAATINPRSHWLRYSWGTVLAERGAYEEAIAKFEWAASINPTYVWRIIDHARLLFGRNDVQGGNDLYRQAIKIAPNAEDVYHRWGNALLDARRYGEAIDKYKKAIEINRDFAPAYSGWGDALNAQGAYSAAISRYLKAIRLNPSLTYAYNGWRYALLSLQRPTEGIEKYKKATKSVRAAAP